MLNKYSKISTVELNSIYKFTLQDIDSKKLLYSNNSDTELMRQIAGLMEVADDIEQELSKR